jgi:hypothetical protein
VGRGEMKEGGGGEEEKDRENRKERMKTYR